MDAIQYLWALPLMALPWVLKFILPQEPQKVLFSQMTLLKKVIQQQSQKKNVKFWLINAARTACLLALILLLAGILGVNPQLDPNASHVFLIDDTFYAHQDEQEGFQQQIKHIHQLLYDLEEQNDVCLLGRSGSSSQWTSPSQLKTLLEKQQAGFQPEQWNKVSSQLTKLQRQRKGSHLAIHLLGSKQCAQIKDFSNWHKQWQHQAKIHDKTTPLAAKTTHASLHISSRIQGESRVFYGKVTPPQNEVQLTFHGIDGQRSDATLPNPFTWALPSQSSGLIQLQDSPGFKLDREHYFHASHRERQNVYLLAPKEASKRLQDSHYYLKKALFELCAQKRWNLIEVSPLAWPKLQGGTRDIFIIHNPKALSKLEKQNIDRFIKQGGQFFLFPGPHTPFDLIDDLDSKAADLSPGSAKTFKVDWSAQQSHASPLQELEFQNGWLFQKLKPETQTQARRLDGSPFWLTRPFPQGGSFHLCSSPFHIAWSKLALSPHFIPLLDSILTPSHQADELGQLTVGDSLPQAQSLRHLMGREHPEQCYPGIFEITQDDGRAQTLALNFPRERFLQRLPMPDIRAIENQTQKETRSGHFNFRIDPYLAIALLLGLLLEAALLYRKSRRAFL